MVWLGISMLDVSSLKHIVSKSNGFVFSVKLVTTGLLSVD